MGAIFGDIAQRDCANCGQRLDLGVPSDEDECKVCQKLGDRSLTRFMRLIRESKSDEERAEIRRRFDAAKGRSYNPAEREVMKR